MGRREDFCGTLRHEQPERMIVDLGGNPLSTMEGRSMYVLLEHLGYNIPDKYEPLPFGVSRRLDESLGSQNIVARKTLSRSELRQGISKIPVTNI
jgi:uroporphyrinogen decarboxylase